MKILAHGIDLVEFGRLEQMLGRHGQRMLDRVFTVREQADAQHLRNRIERLAGRFAAKEAVWKAVNHKKNVVITDIFIKNEDSGKPQVFIKNRKAPYIDVSLSHTGDIVVAVAVSSK